MLTKKITIINKLGLHARAASKLVATASQFACDIKIEKDGKSANAKSMMSVMQLAASNGTEITLTADGKQAETAINQICELINNRFDEDE